MMYTFFMFYCITGLIIEMIGVMGFEGTDWHSEALKAACTTDLHGCMNCTLQQAEQMCGSHVECIGIASSSHPVNSSVKSCKPVVPADDYDLCTHILGPVVEDFKICFWCPIRPCPD